MFLGHYGLALALKRKEPKVSLGTLFIAAQLVDILWGALPAAGLGARAHPARRQSAARPPVLRLPDQPQPAWRARLGRSPRPRSTTRGRRGTPPGTGRRRRWSGRRWRRTGCWTSSCICPTCRWRATTRPSWASGSGGTSALSVGLELLMLGLGLAFYARGRSRRHPLRPIRLAVVLVPLVGGYAGLALRGRRRRASRRIGVSVRRAPARWPALLAAWADRPATPAELAAAGHPREVDRVDRLFFGTGRRRPRFWRWRPARSARTRSARGSRPTCSACSRRRRATRCITRSALIAVAWAASRWPGALPQWAGWLFVAGTVLFSGSLYALALSGVRWLGAITPLGGVAFLAGWVCLALGGETGHDATMRRHSHDRAVAVTLRHDRRHLPLAADAARRLVRRRPPRRGEASSPAAEAAPPAATARSTSPSPTPS